MQSAAQETPRKAEILVISRRRLVVECLTHHFAETAPEFEVISEPPKTDDPDLPVVCIEEVGERAFDAPAKRQIIAEILQRIPRARILVLSGLPPSAEARGWVEAGAQGYFVRPEQRPCS